jgi:hypothetical protein
MHRAAVPPARPHRPAVRADNDPAAAVPLNENAVLGILLCNISFPWYLLKPSQQQLMQKDNLSIF